MLRFASPRTSTRSWHFQSHVAHRRLEDGSVPDDLTCSFARVLSMQSDGLVHGRVYEAHCAASYGEVTPWMRAGNVKFR